MPRKTEWTRDIPRALEELRALRCAVVDRAGLQKLLRLSPRQAVRVMAGFPDSHYAGKSFVIGRADLIAAFERLLTGEEAQREQHRRLRMDAELEAARREMAGRRVLIAASGARGDGRLPRLPAEIDLRPGELRIRFSRASDLLARLYELSQAITADYAGFQKVVEPERQDEPVHSGQALAREEEV